jgi:septal ring factor EnvC (AmiA/AmiB activator)
MFDWDSVMMAVAYVLALCAVVVAWQQRRRVRQWQIAAEEAEAWADEYQRERDALARQAADLMGEVRQLRDARAAMQDLVALRTRQLLALNYSFIAYNVRRRNT